MGNHKKSKHKSTEERQLSITTFMTAGKRSCSLSREKSLSDSKMILRHVLPLSFREGEQFKNKKNKAWKETLFCTPLS